MTYRMIYLVGAPGAGKSTLMERLTHGMPRAGVTGTAVGHGVTHDILFDQASGELIGVELGARRDLFSGTDTMPSSVIERAIPWIQTQPYPLILGEGARLANKRFLAAAVEAGYAVVLAVLDHDDITAWRTARAAAIGREQNPSWVKGRVTATDNLATWAEGQAGISVYRGHPDDLEAVLRPLLSTTGAPAGG